MIEGLFHSAAMFLVLLVGTLLSAERVAAAALGDLVSGETCTPNTCADTGFAPVCCRLKNGREYTYASMCDAQCDAGCNTTKVGVTVEEGHCGANEDRNVVLSGSGEESADGVIASLGYKFVRKGALCTQKASYPGPASSDRYLEDCLVGCDNVDDCRFVTLTRNGDCRYW